MSGLLSAWRRYVRGPKLRSREPFFQYLEKWVLLSTVVGLLTGLVVAVFDYVTSRTLWSFFSEFFWHNPLFVLPVVLGALLTSGYLLRSSSSRLTSGTDEVVKSYNYEAGKMDVRSFPKKMVAAAVTIGLGGSAGQEGPSVYAGGVIGSWLWSKLQRLKLSEEDRNILVLAGASAGIGAVFKAPLTGIIFALEAPFKDDLAHDALVPSLVSSVVSYLTLIAINGPEPLFRFPGVLTLDLLDIGLSAFLGLVAGVLAVAFILFYKNLSEALNRAARHFILKAVIASIAIATIGMTSVWLFKGPYPLGLSYDLIDLALSPNALSGSLLLLFVLKLIATSFTLGSTGVGGIFIPMIVMGAALGGSFGEAFFPSRVDLFVAVAMASFLAAGYKTPLAAVAFVAETTTGPGYLIPALIAAAVSYSVSGEVSVSDYQKLRGEVDVSQIVGLHASDIMTRKVISVPAELSVLDFVEEYLFAFQHKSFPVVDKADLIGRMSIERVRAVPREKWHEVLVRDACDKNVYRVHPDTPVQAVLDIMHKNDIGRVIVVDRMKPNRMVGLVSKSDIIKEIEKRRLGFSQTV